MDDIISVSGHHIGTTKVGFALVSHLECAKEAMVGVERSYSEGEDSFLLIWKDMRLQSLNILKVCL